MKTALDAASRERANILGKLRAKAESHSALGQHEMAASAYYERGRMHKAGA